MDLFSLTTLCLPPRAVLWLVIAPHNHANCCTARAQYRRREQRRRSRSCSARRERHTHGGWGTGERCVSGVPRVGRINRMTADARKPTQLSPFVCLPAYLPCTIRSPTYTRTALWGKEREVTSEDLTYHRSSSRSHGCRLLKLIFTQQTRRNMSRPHWTATGT